jgi:hypothetical protein
MPAKIIFHDLREFRHCYWQGWPEVRIARHSGSIARVVRRLIREQGLLPRDYYASNRFLADERGLTTRRAYTAAASAARRKLQRVL